MSLVREELLYKAYCDMCFYVNENPLSKDKWKKQFHSPSNRIKRTVESIQKELEKIKEHT